MLFLSTVGGESISWWTKKLRTILQVSKIYDVGNRKKKTEIFSHGTHATHSRWMNTFIDVKLLYNRNLSAIILNFASTMCV